MKCYNAFGIKPTNTYTSAGTDYYIPNLDTPEKVERAYKAFEKSYGKTHEYIGGIAQRFNTVLTDRKSNIPAEQIPNLVHLFFAVYDPDLEDVKNTSIIWAIDYFISEFVIYDETNNKVGVKMHLNDTLFINSGIKVALDTVLSDKVAPRPSDAVNLFRMLGIGVAGLYVNKSGNGNKGWDVRACLVDEDYAGFVHLSMSYTKEVIEDKQNIVYCGDKLTQMMLIPVFHDEYIEIDEDNYNKIMENSQRGDKGFGSSDIKH
jgi:dUTPase